MAISSEEAEEFTQALGQVFGGGWRLILHAQRQGIPAALGLSVPEWVETRLGGYVRMSVAERREAVKELTSPPEDGGQGLTQREAAEVLGVALGTVNADVNADPEPVQNRTPEPEPEADKQDNAISDPEPVQNRTPEPEPEAPRTREHVEHNSGDAEWFTPPEFIEAARAVMGAIDLDPASAPEANAVIRAGQFYSAADDGLARDWKGRVWLNPPYAARLVGAFTSRLMAFYETGDVTEACVLVNNATETAWFQDLAARAEAICFPRGRLTFWYPGKRTVTPLQGQAILYLGRQPEAFATGFEQFGTVVIRWD